MKIRTDFVTNSSSSSFVTLRARSRKLAEIFDAVNNDEKIESLQITDDRSGIIISDLEADITPPENINDIVDKLIELAETLGIEDLKEKLRQDEEVIIKDIEDLEFDCGEEGWGEAFGYVEFEDVYRNLLKSKGLDEVDDEDEEPEAIRIKQCFSYSKDKGGKIEKKYTYIHEDEEDEILMNIDNNDICEDEDKPVDTDFTFYCWTEIVKKDGDNYDEESMDYPFERGIMPYDLENLPPNFIDILKETNSIHGLKEVLEQLYGGHEEWLSLCSWIEKVEDISCLESIMMTSAKYYEEGKGEKITLKYSFKTKKGSIKRKAARLEF